MDPESVQLALRLARLRERDGRTCHCRRCHWTWKRRKPTVRMCTYCRTVKWRTFPQPFKAQDIQALLDCPRCRRKFSDSELKSLLILLDALRPNAIECRKTSAGITGAPPPETNKPDMEGATNDDRKRTNEETDQTSP